MQIPMSLRFITTNEVVRVVKITPDHREHRRSVRMALYGENQAIVRAGARIEVGDRVYFPKDFGLGFVETPKIVALVDKETRAATNEWVIGWAGLPRPRATTKETPVALDSDWFAQPLLNWVYEAADGDQTPVGIMGFAGEDLPLDAVMPLVRHLASCGLLRITESAGRVGVALTADGIAAAEQAVTARSDYVRRAQTLRNAMVGWLAEREHTNDATVDWQDFLLDPRSMYHGEFFSIHEMAKEAKYLVEKGLIRGALDEPGQQFGWIMPQLTANGWDCVAYKDGNVNDYLNPPPATPTPAISIIGTATGNQFAIGGDITQTSNQPSPPAPAVPAEALTKSRWARLVAFSKTAGGLIFWAAGVTAAVAAVLALLH